MLCAIAWLVHPSAGHAETRAEQLKYCLADFDGIAWVLPYEPPITIRSCATPTTHYEAATTARGQRRLELIGTLTLPPDDNRLGSDEARAALQTAMLVHFEALFVQRGYRRVAVERANAYTRHYPSRSPDVAMEEPVIPYISMARYVRTEGDREVTLIFRCQSGNTWEIRIDGLPEAADTGSRP